ncbi:MAG: hypothetical protein GWP08_08545 [Nitrospiraceae bacterium]|nr:hypothetical protein [Nitrospiraceae bacterium]
MRTYLVRHGQSQGNLAGTPAPTDPCLTALGRAQAELAAQRLALEPVRAVYASPMTRALETAAPIARGLNLGVRVLPILAETRRLGWYEPPPDPPLAKTGLTARETALQFTEAAFANQTDEDEAWWEALAREDRAGAYRRAAAAWDALQDAHAMPDTIVVVTHGAFGSVLMSAALETAPSDHNRYSQYNCGIGLLQWGTDGIRIRYSNSSSHLPPDMRTDLT